MKLAESCLTEIAHNTTGLSTQTRLACAYLACRVIHLVLWPKGVRVVEKGNDRKRRRQCVGLFSQVFTQSS